MSTDNLAQRVAEALITAHQNWRDKQETERRAHPERFVGAASVDAIFPFVVLSQAALAILAPELAAAEQRGYERGRREVVAAQMLGQEQAASIVTGRKRFTKYSCRECGQMVSNSGLGSWQHEQKHVREKERQHEQG